MAPQEQEAQIDIQVTTPTITLKCQENFDLGEENKAQKVPFAETTGHNQARCQKVHLSI